jgi:hypothetical protein
MRRVFPNLIVIGAMKAGTTSLYRWLKGLPEVWMAQPKELDFFREDRTWSRGPDWYRSHFRDARVRGEASPSYTDIDRGAGVAERIVRTIPDVKLVYLVRDPVRRAVSQYRHGLSRFWGANVSLDAFTDPTHSLVRQGLYARKLEPFLERFSRAQIHITAFEDLVAPCPDARRDILGFLGLDVSLALRFPFPHENTGESKGRLTLTGQLVDRAVSRHVRYRRGGYAVLRLLLRPFTVPAEPVLLPEETRSRLADLFRPDVERFTHLTGHDFRSRWGLL